MPVCSYYYTFPTPPPIPREPLVVWGNFSSVAEGKANFFSISCFSPHQHGLTLARNSALPPKILHRYSIVTPSLLHRNDGVSMEN